MAKAGFWLRGAKGKLAGASMQKGAKGQTIMREIVTPRNPKTNAQLYQRAIMATVMKLYSGMSVICDHSFQGVPVGADCQRRFIKLNSRKLRSALAEAISSQDLDSPYYGFVGPKTNGFVGFEAIISEGNYPVPDVLKNQIRFNAPGSGATAQQFYDVNGLVPGDIYTFVVIAQASDEPQFEVRGTEDLENKAGTMYQHVMLFSRLQVKPVPNALPTKYSDIFTITEQDGMDMTSIVNSNTSVDYPVEQFQDSLSQAIGSYNLKFYGVIRSRLDEDLRSNSTLKFANDFSGLEDNTNGIQYMYVLNAWKQGAEPVGNSDLILEGGNG